MKNPEQQFKWHGTPVDFNVDTKTFMIVDPKNHFKNNWKGKGKK